MSFVVKDRVKETSTTTGTGTLTLVGAVSGFRSFADIGNANTCPYVILEASESAPTQWEVGIGTYTSSGATLSRDTVLRTSAGNTTKITLASGTHTVFCGWAAQSAQQSYLHPVALPSDSNPTVNVGEWHYGSIAAYSADRTFTLPSAAATGDRIGITLVTGDDTYSLLIKTATGDKINGVDCSTTEWSRLLMTGETVVFRCIDGSTVDWVVEHDGRIPLRASMLKNTNTTVATSTITKLNLNEVVLDNAGGQANTTNNRIDVRRAGTYAIYPRITTDAADISGGQARCHKNASSLFNQAGYTHAYSTLGPGFGLFTLAAGDYLELYAYHSTGSSKDLYGAAGDISCSMQMVEQL